MKAQVGTATSNARRWLFVDVLLLDFTPGELFFFTDLTQSSRLQQWQFCSPPNANHVRQSKELNMMILMCVTSDV